MAMLYRTVLRDVGPEAGDMIDAGMLILFALGAPPELAEISVLHDVEHDAAAPPVAGDALGIGAERFRITAVGGTAWQKIAEMGHVVFSFNGAAAAERPGEICVEAVPSERLRALIKPGATLEIADAG